MDPITITGTHWAQISQFVYFMFYLFHVLSSIVVISFLYVIGFTNVF